MKRQPVNVGDKVRYSREWLRSTATHTGPLPFARGTVTEITGNFGPKDAPGLATVDWNDPDIPARVLRANLERADRPPLL